MTRTPPALAAVLIQHEAFVRSVVRGVLAEASGAEDAVQETWSRALLRAPADGALGGWLARVARNVASDWNRSAARRRARERAALRPEGSVEPLDLAQARLSAQREVVGAVLALEEPYRSVVLLRYYQELAPAEIGARLGRSAATVRSQLSRAHELLRGELEGVGGEGAAWAALLAPGGAMGWGERLATAAGTTSMRAAAAVATAAALAGAFLARPAGKQAVPPRSTGGVELARGAPEGDAEPGSAALLAPADPAAAAGERTAVAGPASASSEERPDLAALSFEELYRLAVQAQVQAESALLTVGEPWTSACASLLALPNTGLARIVDTLAADGELGHAVTVRGGGAYYSFATRSNDYDREPDLSYRFGELWSGFYGGQIGLLMPLGNASLESLPSSPDPAPAWLTAEEQERWRMLWQEGLDSHPFPPGGVKPGPAPETFLLRVVSPGEHDHVVAFRTLELDQDGCTLAWRVLKSWPVGERSTRAKPPPAVGAPAAAWLQALELPGLLALLRDLRAQAAPELLLPPPEAEEQSRDLGASCARILHRGRWDALVGVRGAGAYYSFGERSHAYGDPSDLELQQDHYLSGFAGTDRGFFLDLGVVPPAELPSVLAGRPPHGLDGRQRAAFDFLWTVRGHKANQYSRLLSKDDAARAEELGLKNKVPALLGHTYLLRTAEFDSHDHLVVFTTLEVDERGHTLAWRILHTWPVDD